MRSTMRVLAAAVVTAAALTGTAWAHGFTYGEVYLGYLKLAPPADMDQATDWYMEATQHAAWRTAKSNEIEWPDRAKKAKEALKSQVGAFNLGEPFELEARGQLKDYDPKTQTFGFSELTAETKVSPDGPLGSPKLTISFLNTFTLARLKVPAPLASEFLKKVGTLRFVRLHVGFVPVKAFPGTGVIKANIKSLTVTSEFTSPQMTLATVHLP